MTHPPQEEHRDMRICIEPARSKRRPRQALALLIVLTLVVAGCGGSSSPSVAHIGTDRAQSKTSSASDGTGKKSALDYAACMRSHGVPDFPDPNSQGTFTFTGRLNASSPQYQKANDTCKDLLPAGDGGQISSTQSQRLESYGLQYAKCMRSHGLSDFPDPKQMSNGSINLSAPGIDTNSPQYKAAGQTCQAKLHNSGGGA
jgi:hypothetical protein